MRKVVVVFCMLVAIASASQRTVVAEQFTATWCQYCPGAARAHKEMYRQVYDSLVIIAYHPSSSDPFYSTEAVQRMNYYSVPGYPTSWFDGTIEVIGGLHTGTMYPYYRDYVTNRLAVSSPLEVSLECNYDSAANTGQVTATVYNSTAGQVDGTIHFAIVENEIPYAWQGMSQLEFLMRDMLPDANGEAVSVPAGDTIMRSRDFTVEESWNELKCKIVVFVQASDKQIYQGAEAALIQEPAMEYYGMSLTETDGNGNGIAEPGESITMSLSAKNLGNGEFSDGVGIGVSDLNVYFTNINHRSVSIGAGDVDTVIDVDFEIDAACPDPNSISFYMYFGTSVDTIPFVITGKPGFSDDMESGEGDWTHFGIRDQWHLTEHKSNSPTHSWYCGFEGSWFYYNESDASLATPYFVVPPDSTLYLSHQYGFENTWDFGYIDVDNGSGWWKTLERFNGVQSSWVQESYPLSEYNGQTIRIRFRFTSDNATNLEGWYIDDVEVPTDIGIEEYESPSTQTLVLDIVPNPFAKETQIVFQSDNNSEAAISIYDATGRLVKDFGSVGNGARIVWPGIDDRGLNLPAGIYFVKLSTGTTELLKKVILVR